jgi:hypothetical protein
MFSYRAVRTARIPQNQRDMFERYGVAVIQLTITSGFNPASEDLRQIYNDVNDARLNAEAWLIEQVGRQANKEWRLEIVDWAILIFVIVGVFADFSLVFHWFGSK